MTPERWQVVKQLFFSALARDPGQRGAYLSGRCAGDVELRDELESLLAQHERSAGFLSRPASAIAVEQRLHELAGQRLQHYEIERLIGAGGMGAVYAARDVRLGRRVAIKLLPPYLAPDPARAARLRREAQVGSQLNHPNIVTVHEIGQLDELCFIVTELVDGDTLEARIAAGPLGCDDVLAIATQLADALAEAHGRGIVHRDIKPSNLMLTARGQLKVLDLGLAKRIGDGPERIDGRGHQPVSIAVMGTAPYMSPEQSRGEDVDPRSDLFSVGVVLYQLVTGVLPFSGASLDEVLEQVRHRAPVPPSRLVAAVPAELERIIARCLAKRADERHGTAAALLHDLQELARARRPPTARAGRPGRARWRGIGVGFAGASVLAVYAIFAEQAGPVATRRPEAVAATPAAAPRGAFIQLTRDAGEELFPELAPDGSWFVYASRASGSWHIYRRVTSGGEPVDLTAGSAQDNLEPAISPDGTRIAFRSERDGGGLFVMAADGTGVRRLSAIGGNPTWSPDGLEIVYATVATTFPHSRRPGELRAVRLTTGEQRVIAEADATQPAYSPHGLRVAYWGLHPGSGRRDIWTIAVRARGAEPVPVPVTDDDHLDWNPRWSPDGARLYFLSNRGGTMNLWSVAIDEHSGAVRGAPAPVTLPCAYVAHASFSADGERMIYAQVQTSSNLQRVAFDPVHERVTGAPSFVTHGSLEISGHDLSPDGTRLVVTASDAGHHEGLYLLDVGGTLQRRLTDGRFHDRAPRWCPDGQRIAFYSDRTGKYEIWAVRPDGSGLTQLTDTRGGDVYYPIWSPDGGQLLYQHRGMGNFLIASDRPWAGQTARRLLQEGVAVFTPWAWSPDGQKLVGGLRRTGRPERSLGIYELATGRYEDLTTRGLEPAVWLSDSRRVIFHDRDTLYVIDTATRRLRALVSVAPDTLDTITVANHDRTLYFGRTSREADIWLAPAGS